MWDSGEMITNAVQSHIKKDMWSTYITVRRPNFFKKGMDELYPHVVEN